MSTSSIQHRDPAAAAQVPAATRTTWQIDPAHTAAEFAVKHLMISTVRGHFGTVTGVVHANETDPRETTLEVDIAVASIDTRNEQRDAHLRSPDFLDAERFPSLTFRSKRVEGDPNATLRVVGDLTIRGVTREIVLEVESEGRTRDPWGNDRAGFSAKAKLSRKDFGLTWNQLLEAGGVSVGDEVKIAIDVELVKQKAQAAA